MRFVILVVFMYFVIGPSFVILCLKLRHRLKKMVSNFRLRTSILVMCKKISGLRKYLFYQNMLSW